MVTVVLNGKQLICRTNIPDPLEGRSTAMREAGADHAAGDHGAVEYRNLTITPAR